MHILFGLLLLLCILFFSINHHRKKCILKKLCHMDTCEKVRLLDELTQPFGFSYLCQEDIITSNPDAWQREFGYCALFDRTAPHFNMVFDCEPIYFSYQDQTWLIEFWKGQYGINTGGEIGIYRSDSLVPLNQRSTTVFHAIPDQELFPMSMELFCQNQSLFAVRQRHWWLTGFRMGRFSRPEDLIMNCSITFPNHCMLQSFVDAMLETGYAPCELNICNLMITFKFSTTKTRQPRFGHRILIWWVNCKNRLFCRAYCLITHPCTCTLDKILYLYYFLPVAFRCMLRLKRVQKS